MRQWGTPNGSAYDRCLAHDLTLRRVPFVRPISLPVDYKGVRVHCGYRVDGWEVHEGAVRTRPASM